MTNKAKATNRVDELLDELLADDHSPEAVLGENGLLKQLSKRLVERALAGELSHPTGCGFCLNLTRNFER